MFHFIVQQIAADQSDDTPEEKKGEKSEKKEDSDESQTGDEKDGDSTKTTSGNGENSKRLYVQRAMTKAERIAMLKEKFNLNIAEKQKQQGVNLYVKNLGDQVGHFFRLIKHNTSTRVFKCVFRLRMKLFERHFLIMEL